MEVEMDSRVLGYLVLACCACFAHPAIADVIIFHDLSDQETVEHIGTQRSVVIDGAIAGAAAGSCAPGEAFGCFVEVSSLNGATPTSPLSLFAVGIAEPGLDPSVAFSDAIISQVGNGRSLLEFESDPSPTDPNPEQNVLGISPFPVDKLLLEDGTIQTAFTITWSDETKDTIQFQSDLDRSVPEPASAILVATALVGFRLLRRHG
jgi:hypothetical protein